MGSQIRAGGDDVKPIGYRLPDNRTLRVSSGISGGRCWCTAYGIKRGSSKRYKSHDLPLRESRDQAETDLAAYAAKKGLEPVYPSVSHPYGDAR